MITQHGDQDARAAGHSNALDHTRTSDTGQARGDNRAKTLGKAPDRGPNPWLQKLRARAQQVLIGRYAGEKRAVSAFSRMVGASRSLIVKWLDPKEVDQHPVPLAMLWAVDDDEFESLYVVIRADRRAMREGR